MGSEMTESDLGWKNGRIIIVLPKSLSKTFHEIRITSRNKVNAIQNDLSCMKFFMEFITTIFDLFE